MLEEGMDTESVSDKALFKMPSIKRKRLKTNAEKEKPNQLTETQADKNNGTESIAVNGSDSDTVDNRSRWNRLVLIHLKK